MQAADPGTITVDTDKSRLDIPLIHRFLSGSYWAAGIPFDVVERSVRNSLCFGLYEDGRQIGFARIITDHATFAFLCDVFVLESHRGRGFARKLMSEVTAHPSLQGLRRWVLATRDAHTLYEKYGFKRLAAPDRWMELHFPDVYATQR